MTFFRAAVKARSRAEVAGIWVAGRLVSESACRDLVKEAPFLQTLQKGWFDLTERSTAQAVAAIELRTRAQAMQLCFVAVEPEGERLLVPAKSVALPGTETCLKLLW